MMSFKIKKRCVTVDNVTIEYLLKRESLDHAESYSIEITKHSDDGQTACRLADIARSEENALRLLDILAENAVCPKEAPYVIDDLADSITFC